MFIENESFKHLFAKNLLYRWLIECERDIGWTILPFIWNNPNYGVHKELKIYETSDIYYFENSGGVIVDGTFKPKFDPLFDRGKILFVPDICVFHKGQIRIMIEIVHTHPTPRWKLHRIKKFANGQDIEVFEVDAEEILRQTKRPIKLKCTYIDLKKVVLPLTELVSIHRRPSHIPAAG